MSAPAVRFRATRPEDLPSLDRLLERRFGHPIAPEEWHWKYGRIPGEARSRVAVDAAGRVVAHAGALGLPARLDPAAPPRTGDRTVWQLSDWAGSTAGAGLRPALVELGRELLADLPRPGDTPWIFGFPSIRHFRLGRRVFGYRVLPAIMPLAGLLTDAVARAGGAHAASGDGGGIEVSDHCGDWAEATWEACAVRGIRRTAAWLNWRYHARPGRYYRFYRLRPASGPEGVDGLAVFAFVADLARGAELWLPPGGPGGAGAVERWGPGLAAVARDLDAAGLVRWELWPPPAPCGLDPLLRGMGLEAAAEAVFMGCRGRDGRLDGPSPADARFHYSMGDYDLV